MHNEPEKSYPDLPDLTEEALDPNSSYGKILELIGDRGRVLDVGCASGYLARLLAARGHHVTGLDVSAQALEIAAQYCDRTVEANLDVVTLTDLFPTESFDVVIFADVLEHLRNPWQVLDDARRLLGFRGHAIVSIPNIAHGAIRLSLLQGQFNYTEFGILDNTHLRFFTRRTVEELFVRTGYRVERLERTVLPLFAPSNLVPSLDPSDFEAATVASIRRDPDFETLQFVARVEALSDDQKLAQVTQRYLDVSAKLELKAESEMPKQDYGRLLARSEQLERQLRRTEAEKERISGLLEAAEAELQNHKDTTEQLREERGHFRRLQQREAELQLTLSTLADSMERAVRALEERVAATNSEVRHYRAAYDQLCGQVAMARGIARRAKPNQAYDLLIARNEELLSNYRSLLSKSQRAGLKNTSLWRAARSARRRLARLTGRAQAPKPASSR